MDNKTEMHSTKFQNFLVLVQSNINNKIIFVNYWKFEFPA